MKKTGFTLAEVLITLAIIGVVATMTLPALMNNTQEQQAKTGLKKGINTLTEAAQTNLAVDGFDFGSVKDLSTTEPAEGEQSIAALLNNRTQIDYQITNFGAAATSNAGKAVDATSTNQVIFFRDGSALSVQIAKINPTSQGAIESDGLPKGIGAVYDYNGAKGPNLLSNCKGTATVSAKNGKQFTDEDDIAKCTKTKRVIKDQFGVKLRGGYVYPNGAAARWAFNN